MIGNMVSSFKGLGWQSWRTSTVDASTFIFALLSLPGLICLPSGAQTAPDFNQVSSAAAAAREAGDLIHAVDLYSAAVRLNPGWADGWWYLGTLLYGRGEYPEARDALTHFIELTPHAGPATALRGLCEFEAGDYPAALKDVNAGIAQGAANQPRNEHILRAHQALLLTRNGQFAEALGAYAFFGSFGPPEPDMAVGMGLAGLRKPLLPKEVALSDRDMYLATGNAMFHFMSGDAAGAKLAFSALFERYPTLAGLHYLYGYYLFPTDPDAAEVEFRRELTIFPTSSQAEAILSWIEILRNQPGDAVPYARRAVADDPSLPLAQLVLGRSMVETGDIAGGLSHLERALALEPGNLEVHLALARAYSESGRKEDAFRERMQSLQLTKDEQVAQP
ncbi:MAG TPA: tetratricopeptide repeat protein [Acidisarcina sp.]